MKNLNHARSFRGVRSQQVCFCDSKNSYFRNSFISTLAVTVVGVLLFGVNAALSETPTVSPPGDGVGPTFSDMTIDPTGNINAAKITPGKIIDQNGNVVDTGSLHVEGGIEVSNGLKVDNISSSSSTSVSVNNGLDVKGYLEVTGNINNPGPDVVAIVDNVTISGNISNPGAPVTIDDHLVVNNSIDAKNVIKNSGTANSGNLVIDDSLVVNGKITATSIGTYSYEKSGDKTILFTAGALTSETVLCPTGYEVISCYGKASSATTYDGEGTAFWWGKNYTFAGNDITSSSASTPNDTCTTHVVTVKTLTATTKATFKAAAVCYDSNI